MFELTRDVVDDLTLSFRAHLERPAEPVPLPRVAFDADGSSHIDTASRGWISAVSSGRRVTLGVARADHGNRRNCGLRPAVRRAIAAWDLVNA